MDHLSSCMADVAAGDADALGDLYDRTSRLVFALALRILRRRDEADEVVLDVYTQVWKTAARFDARRGSIEAWLLMMARARAIDRLRARAARPDTAQGLPGGDVPLPGGGDSSEAESAWDARRRVAVALGHLAPTERRLVELAFFDGYSHSELARRCGLPLGTVKTRIRAALHRMRRALDLDARHPAGVGSRRTGRWAGALQ